MLKRRVVWGLGLSALVLLLAACGGGGDSGGGGNSGGGGASPGTPAGTVQPPATLVEDVLPSGTRIDVSAKNLFPLGLDDNWTYKRLDATDTAVATVTRRVTQANGTSRSVLETASDSPTPVTDSYTKTAQGITDATADPTLPLTAQNIIGPLPEYVEPLYPVGTTRILRRAGSWGTDINGDGVAEGFRFEFAQIFRGFETLNFGTKAVEVAHFSTTVTLTLISSNPKDPAVVVVGTDEAYFASGFGLVKEVTEYRSGTGQVLMPRATLLLDTATVGGMSWANFLALQGQLRSIDLTHTSLIYAPRYNSYLATIPNQSPNPNDPPLPNASSIAVIDASTGQVRYVPFPDTSPVALALAADGNSVYVGLNAVATSAPSTVKRLALPGLSEIGSVNLPQPLAVFPPERTAAIAASPIDAATFAVSLILSPGLGDGVSLVQNMTLQPKKPTTTNVGSIVFSADGKSLFGFNNSTTSELGLRRFTVLDDGLAESQLVTQAAGFGEELSRIGERLVLGNRIYGQDLAVTSSLSSVRCFAGRTAVLCQPAGTSGTPPQGAQRIALYDPVTLAPGATVSYGASITVTQKTRYVQGPAGQVAITVSDDLTGLPRSLVLFDSPLLP